jgi:hypothetical protein
MLPLQGLARRRARHLLVSARSPARLAAFWRWAWLILVQDFTTSAHAH